MAEKKIVSIEDRIPKLKENRKKKANRRLVLYLSLFFLLIVVILYLQSSLSNVSTINVKGNTNIKKETIVSLTGLSNEDNFWKVDTDAIQKKVNEHAEVNSVKVEKDFPSTISIQVNEFERVGYVQKNGAFYPILETGESLTSYSLSSPGSDAPLLRGWEKQTYLEEMTRELRQLPSSVTRQISELYWTPTEKNPYKIHLYMNDGFEVEASIRNFSENMRTYPSIVSQLDPGQKGIIHIDVGAYFEAYPSSEAEGESSNEDNR
ncbi:cell division protein FtsQ/DivIB [Pontibacillus marinus]|uniref:Cell division protein DivIB n=1 Tax=Pontibacillus marinus BH030004 = DSM 16465 TaxID=1385511 RepID=A0A0A5FVI8_9BACI|nr:cell division protein FtsQ/DivIB [Pontibacillus marinus]KGX83929.1 cell division protein FtsQ [Pontibacillus marinus BH030004 = DSM 16465]